VGTPEPDLTTDPDRPVCVGGRLVGDLVESSLREPGDDGSVADEGVWKRLLDYLNTWAEAREVDGGIEVALEHPDGVRRTVEVVLTPEDWQDYLGTTYGTTDPEVSDVKPMILLVPPDQRYLVYQMYAFRPSDVPTLPSTHPTIEVRPDANVVIASYWPPRGPDDLLPRPSDTEWERDYAWRSEERRDPQADE
jgi:hypothetical protein